jgi:ribosomal protection tetracycline resistance protein
VPTLNLGILAHVDAGKTSLTERLLYAAGVIDEIGSVDHGSTTTDTLALERQRGITIKSAVVSFAIDDVTVNLIDTPGHPDFIAEVERVLSVLDGAVLVISAVEGVQAQTRVLMRTLRRLRIPTIIFVNKIDRRGAQYETLLASISEKLTPAIVEMGAATELDLLELLAEHDDALLAAFVDNESVGYTRLRKELAVQTRQALVHPVFFGSAITGAGIDELTAGIRDLLGAADGDPDGPVEGTVFKIERGPAGEKIAYVRMFHGTVRTRDRLRFGQKRAGKVTAVSVFASGTAERRQEVVAGEIGLLWGLGEIRIGDAIGTPRATGRHGVNTDSLPGAHPLRFAPPTLETIVVPDRLADRGRLHVALTQLAEQDPLINVTLDDLRQEVSVSLYGEVQKEVIQATLADDFGVAVSFRETTTICVERPAGTGEAVEIIDTDPNPFLATVGLRVEPAPIGSGVDFRLEVELGSMPFAFFKAVEETVKETLHQGIHGWQVLDCTVTMTHSGYWAKQSHAHAVFDKSMSSTAGDFRNVTPMVLMSALEAAGTTVYEPMHRFGLDIPADTFGAVQAALVQHRAVPRTSTPHRKSYRLEGEIPADRVHELHRRLPSLTRGEGVLESAFDHYQEVRGVVPSRPRTDHNPLNRREYLLRVNRLRG